MHRRTHRADRRQKNKSVRQLPMVDPLESRAYLSVTFSSPALTAGVSNPTGIASGDFLGNGESDVVVAGTAGSSPSVDVFLNTNGSIGKPTVLGATGTTGGVATGDFLGNGRSDIAVVDNADNALDVFLSNADGTFTRGPGAALNGDFAATEIVSADFNGDGKADVAVLDPTQNDVILLFSEGNGLFANEGTISVPSPTAVVAADLNGDGHPDLVIASAASPGGIYVAMNNGSGTFATPTIYPMAAAVTGLAVDDFNGDGHPDIVATEANGFAAVLINNSSGLFSLGAGFTVPTNVESIVAGDFTGLGHGDVATLSTTGALDVFAGNGDGTFQPDQSVFTTQLGSPTGQAVVANFANGRPGIAYESANGGFGLTNNTNGAVTPITGPASPIVPTLLTPLPTKTLINGGKNAPIHELVRLTNSGSTTFSQKVTLTLLLSTDTTLDASDIPAATAVRTLRLRAHKSALVAFTIRSLPAGASGTYHILADATDASSRTTVTPSSARLTIVPAVIDLAAGLVHVPTSAKLGRKTPFSISVSNAGNIPTSGPLEIRVYSSQSGFIDSGAVEVADIITRVPVRPSKKVIFQLFKTIILTATSYKLIVQVDPTDAFHDINPSNNTIVSGPIANT